MYNFIFVGLVFVAQGGSFAISSPFWGYLCDKKINGKIVSVIGILLTIISLLFLGPIYFIPIKADLRLCVVMLALQGIGTAAQLVSSLSISYKAGKGDNYILLTMF